MFSKLFHEWRILDLYIIAKKSHDIVVSWEHCNTYQFGLVISISDSQGQSIPEHGKYKRILYCIACYYSINKTLSTAQC